MERSPQNFFKIVALTVSIGLGCAACGSFDSNEYDPNIDPEAISPASEEFTE